MAANGSTLCFNFERAREAGKGLSYSTGGASRYTSRIKPSIVVLAGEIKEPLDNAVNPTCGLELDRILQVGGYCLREREGRFVWDCDADGVDNDFGHYR